MNAVHFCGVFFLLVNQINEVRSWDLCRLTNKMRRVFDSHAKLCASIVNCVSAACVRKTVVLNLKWIVRSNSKEESKNELKHKSALVNCF